MGQVESQFFPFGDSVSVGARWVHCLRQTYHQLRNHFGRTRSYHKVTGLKWKVVSVLLEIVLILTQDRGTVCVEHTNGSKIIFEHPLVLRSDEAQVKARFGPFGDSANLDTR